MEDICNVFGQVDRYLAKVEWSQHKDKMNITVKEEARKRIIDVVKVREMFFSDCLESIYGQWHRLATQTIASTEYPELEYPEPHQVHHQENHKLRNCNKILTNWSWVKIRGIRQQVCRTCSRLYYQDLTTTLQVKFLTVTPKPVDQQITRWWRCKSKTNLAGEESLEELF